MTPAQKFEQERYDSFKEGECEIYKSYHRHILKDDGIAKMKKTSFRMPGYRQILNDKKEEEYTI